MANPQYPLLYQVNTRVWLTDLSRQLGRPATLDDIPDADLDRFAQSGFDWVWFLSVWQTGAAGQRISRSHPEWRKEFQETLHDLRDADIAGSGFAIADYTVHALWEEMRRSLGCANDSTSAGYGCCSTLFPITPRWITAG